MLFNIITLYAQQNLVQNGSFEQTTYCPESSSQIILAPNWFSPTDGTPDLMATCSDSSDNAVPQNFFGYQFPYEGENYSGIMLFTFGGDYREYIATRLLQPLKPNTYYCFSVAISMSDNCRQPISTLGVLFLSDSIYYNHHTIINLIPQILNSASNYINNTIGWVLFNSTFTAQGGEKYVYIGNFLPDSLTNVYEPNQSNIATYFYIDDVRLYECDSLNNVEETTDINAVTLYPNPSTGDIAIEIKQPLKKAYIEVYDAIGKLIYSTQLTDNLSTIIIPVATNGIYSVRLWNNNEVIKHDKLVIIK